MSHENEPTVETRKGKAPTARMMPMSLILWLMEVIRVLITPKTPTTRVTPASASINFCTFSSMPISVAAICLTAVAMPLPNSDVPQAR